MATTYFEEIRALRKEGLFADAVLKIDAVLSELDLSAHQKRAELLNEKARCYTYQRNYEAAEKNALQALSSASQPPAALKEQGWALTELGIIFAFGMLRDKEAEKALT